jgi:hypothetical protein
VDSDVSSIDSTDALADRDTSPVFSAPNLRRKSLPTEARAHTPGMSCDCGPLACRCGGVVHWLVSESARFCDECGARCRYYITSKLGEKRKR